MVVQQRAKTARVLSNSVGRSEHVANVMRMRRAGLIALVAWPAFGILDWFITAYIQPGNLTFYLSLRLVGFVMLLVGVARLYARKMPSKVEVRVLDSLMCISASALVTLSCTQFGGIASPLALGVVTVILCRSAIMSDHWRRGIMPIMGAALVHPLTLLFCAPFSVEIARQFTNPQAIAGFILNLVFVMGAAVITLVGGHLVWTLRRQIYQARSLGRYRLTKLIGKGGMGEVWKAHHHGMKRDVAVKVLRPESANDELAVARFEREVRATAELSHPHTIRVFDYGTTEDGLWYYAMELLIGCDLQTLIQREGPLHPSRAVKMIWQATKALSEAHGRGIIHRDIKPENLFLTHVAGEGDFIKVLDFGLAKVLESKAKSDPNLTNVGWAVGTPKYVSPEVVFGRPADARSDVYGLGAVLYYLLCGQAPFDFDDVRKTLMAHMNEEAVKPSEKLGRAIPAAIEAVVMRALTKDPDGRFASAADFVIALENAAAVTSDIPTRRVPLKRPLAAPRKSRVVSTAPAQLVAQAFDDIEFIEPDTFVEVEEVETKIDHRLPVFS